MGYLLKMGLTHLDNILRLDENLDTLKRKVANLNAIKEDNESAKSKELRPTKRIKREVEVWFQNVERINGEIQNLETETKASNFLLRGLHGQNILKRMQEVDALIQQAKSLDGLVINEPQWIGQALLTTRLFGESATTCMNDIWACLMGDDVSKIGVWGMGGVGKTTIMKLIHNQLLKETEKFNVVIWVTVSKEVNIFKLQKTIARALNLTLSKYDGETVRAGKIGEMLGRKGKYVLILDDLWDEQFSLEEVGIPEPSDGCKLLVTTRSSDVCRNLDCHTIEVRPLSEPDAWTLFSHKVGQKVLNDPHLLPIVQGVAEECGGLPLAIVTIASGMKGVLDIYEWRNALYELKRNVRSVSGMEEKVFQRLQFSYDLLRDAKLKQCFLFCALYPEDHKIFVNDLIELWIAEGLVEEMGSRLAEFDRGRTILKKLKNSCLVEGVRLSSDYLKDYGIDGVRVEETYVKLHDVVRDMALRIQSGSGRPRILVKAGMQLRVMPDLEEWNEDLEKVSLMENHQLQIPSQMRPNCPKLTTLLLSRCDIESIPECFFEHLYGLKTLDLSRNFKIKSLPNSISNLEGLTTLLLSGCCIESISERFFEHLHGLKTLDLSNNSEIERLPKSISSLEALTTLLLYGCSNLKVVPSISELQALKKLDLEATKVTNLPDWALKRLTNLTYIQLADNREKENVEKVADGVFTKLTCLHHLVITSRYLKGEEIGGLRNLKYFEGRFFDLNELSCYVDALLAQNKLPIKYSISVGREAQSPFGKYINTLYGNYIEKKSLIIDSGEICRDGIKILHDVEALKIVKCSSVELCEENAFFGLFKPVPHHTFSSLTSICIAECKKIKKLFPSTWALQNLQNLGELRVEGCQEMEEIIAISESEGIVGGTIKSITLPKLQKLYLEDLPELKSICSANGVMVCDSVENFAIWKCPKLKLKNLSSFKSVATGRPNFKGTAC